MGWVRGRAVVALAMAWCLFGAHPAQAGGAEEQAASPAPGTLATLSQLVIPSDLGQVSQILEEPSAPSPAAKRLILIEDAHVNYEAQQHLAAILERLASAYGVTLILVEGSEGDAGLSYMRRFGSKADRRALAEERLKAGALSGEEYLDLASDLPLTLWGVDDLALYEQQYAAFLDVERAREQAGDGISRLRAAVDQIKAQSPNEPLRAFESNQAAFAAGTLKFSAYADYLSTETRRLQLSLEDSPHLEALMEATRLEPALDKERVGRQQRAALERARAAAPEPAWRRFAETAERLKAGNDTPAAYYEALGRLLRQAGVDASAAFPALSQYLRYMSLRAGSGGRAWWTELAALERGLRAALAGSPEERELAGLADRVARCERLLRLEWTSDDRAAVVREPDHIRPTVWLPALQAQARRAGVAVLEADAAALDEALVRAKRFYDLSEGRDEALVARALAKMDAAGEGTAILIAGGFHTGGLLERLAARQVQVAVVTPWAGVDDDPTRYASILKEKYEQYRQRRAAH